MTDYTTEINTIFDAVQYRSGPAAEVAVYNAALQGGTMTVAQVTSAIENDPYTMNIVNPVIREYEAAFGRVPAAAGASYWVNQFAANPAELSQMSVIFANSAEFMALYGADATTPTNAALVTALYTNVLGRPPAAAGLAYWVAQPLDAAQLLQAFSQSQEYIINTASAILGFQNAEAAYALDPTTAPDPYSGSLWQYGLVTGKTYVLTPGIDTIDITTPYTLDTVKGVIDQKASATDTTFTVGDSITGNGHTVVDLAIASLATNAAAQLVTMSGVSTVNFAMGIGAGATTLDANGSTWGSVNNLNLNGFAHQNVNVTKMNITSGGLALNVQNSGAHLNAAGHMTGMSFYADLQAGSVGSVASLGSNGITANLGKGGGYADLDLYHHVDNTAGQGAATVGDIKIGNIALKAASGAYFSDVSIYNEAHAVSNAATVGSVTVGNVSFAGTGNAHLNYLSIYNYADVAGGKGDATAGNVTVGNVSLMASKATAYQQLEIYNEAYAHTGNATVGNVAVGNVSVNWGHTGDIYIDNYARVTNTGNATVGNVAVGNVGVVNAATNESIYTDIYNYAEAYNGAALAGNVTVGQVNATANYYNDIYIYNEAYVQKTGAATVGSVGVGNVSLLAKGAGDNYMEIYNEAYVSSSGKGGAATAGNVTVGTVSMSDSTGYNELYIYNSAHAYGSKTADAKAGNTSVGNITLTHNADMKTGATGGTNDIHAYQSAYSSHGNATVGNVTLGNIVVNPAGVALTGNTNVHNYIYVYNEAIATKVATAGSVTIGTFTGQTGAHGHMGLYVDNYAKGATSADATGKVTVGNVSMAGASKADMRVEVYNETNKTGTAGGIALGNVSIKASKGAGTGSVYAYQSGGAVGSVSVGNVAITATRAHLFVENYAYTGNAGGVTVGNVSLVGNINTTSAMIEQYAVKGNVGAVTVGAVTLTPKGTGLYELNVNNEALAGNSGLITIGNVSLNAGAQQTSELYVVNSAANNNGGVTLGNLNIAVHNTNANIHVASGYVDVSATHGAKGGNISVGNITIGSSGVTTKAALTKANMHAAVTLDTIGNINIGNITVSGGVLMKTGTVNSDNLANLTGWLHTTAGAGKTVTVGNIDYSGYVGLGAYDSGTNPHGTAIDVQTYTGAGLIKGAQGGSTITDNSGTNAIDLSATAKADNVYLQSSQTAVVDSGTAITATQTAMDSITGIHTGDIIEFSNGTGGGAAISGSGIVQAGNVGTWATFLLNAETQVTHNHNAVYTADLGGNTYVAMMNSSGHVGEIVEVVGVHTFTLTSGVLHFAA
jgi:hypothetical protein